MRLTLRTRLARFAIALAVVCTLIVGVAPPVFAGTTGQIDGTVVDATTGSPVAGAQVVANSPTDHRATTTDAKGFYVLQALSADTYSVSVNATGYTRSVFPASPCFKTKPTGKISSFRNAQDDCDGKLQSGSLVKADQTETATFRVRSSTRFHSVRHKRSINTSLRFPV